jgi:hypothetical protein
LTAVACLALFGIGILGTIYSGVYDVAAINPDNAFLAWALHETSDRSVAARLGDIHVIFMRLTGWTSRR